MFPKSDGFNRGLLYTITIKNFDLLRAASEHVIEKGDAPYHCLSYMYLSHVSDPLVNVAVLPRIGACGGGYILISA